MQPMSSISRELYIIVVYLGIFNLKFDEFKAASLDSVSEFETHDINH